MERPCSDYLSTAVQTALDIHRQRLPGDILVFLTGQDECQAAVRLLREGSDGRVGDLELQAMPLYAGLAAAQQLAALAPAPRGVRKVRLGCEAAVVLKKCCGLFDCG